MQKSVAAVSVDNHKDGRAFKQREAQEPGGIWQGKNSTNQQAPDQGRDKNSGDNPNHSSWKDWSGRGQPSCSPTHEGRCAKEELAEKRRLEMFEIQGRIMDNMVPHKTATIPVEIMTANRMRSAPWRIRITGRKLQCCVCAAGRRREQRIITTTK